MNIIKTRDLSEDMINQINSIVEAQDKEHHLPLYFDFSDERCVYYLCYKGENLMSVFALFEIDDNIYEVIAFTDTANRKKGYFKALLNFLYTDLKNGTELSFICERNFLPAIECAKKLSFDYDSTETMMELDLSTYQGDEIPDIDIYEEDNDIFYIYYKDEEIGSFGFYTFNFDTGYIYFHSFNIYEEYQTKGLGKLSMRAILLFLKDMGKTKIHLQLLLENTPAYKIYKDLGFSISSELSYYKKFI
ncbi:GNAT family N-acetyltransferase [Lachnoanaerobaculum gingivalis]|uniref:GNAT family N-acetyltransferase n=1 Tax=Lachnoanaerobaculum gingivalis TaxID=2490855 RepID=A0A3P3QUK8_9FIRM|nr:GNAT family N-acetyltransferase [Lachnoanaerobaculum gingivalis]RRJ24884.1 GNAT family N-acetyltransferase [Lachnoanaerobaculum gingivalis]